MINGHDIMNENMMICLAYRDHPYERRSATDVGMTKVMTAFFFYFQRVYQEFQGVWGLISKNVNRVFEFLLLYFMVIKRRHEL
jgi:hypothetical protein